MFKDLYPDEQLAYRTKRIVDMVANEIRSLDANADAEAMATAILKSGLKIKDSENNKCPVFRAWHKQKHSHVWLLRP